MTMNIAMLGTGRIADFVAAVTEGRAPEVDGREGLRNVAGIVRR